MLLRLLHDEPAHGYELIRRVSDQSQGYYSPSPGALYPALAQLEARGLVLVESKGRRKLYRLSAEGRQHLKHNAVQAQQLLAVLDHAAKKMLWMKHAGENLMAAANATGWLPEFVQARKALQAALLAQNDSCPQEQQRIITILQRATHDILKNAPTRF